MEENCQYFNEQTKINKTVIQNDLEFFVISFIEQIVSEQLQIVQHCITMKLPQNNKYGILTIKAFHDRLLTSE